MLKLALSGNLKITEKIEEDLTPAPSARFFDYFSRKGAKDAKDAKIRREQ